jgi:hypothetical protein
MSRSSGLSTVALSGCLPFSLCSCCCSCGIIVTHSRFVLERLVFACCMVLGKSEQPWVTLPLALFKNRSNRVYGVYIHKYRFSRGSDPRHSMHLNSNPNSPTQIPCILKLHVVLFLVLGSIVPTVGSLFGQLFSASLLFGCTNFASQVSRNL